MRNFIFKVGFGASPYFRKGFRKDRKTIIYININEGALVFQSMWCWNWV